MDVFLSNALPDLFISSFFCRDEVSSFSSLDIRGNGIFLGVGMIIMA